MQNFKQNSIRILSGYIPGAIGRILDLHGRYYSQRFGWGLHFETDIATELSAFLHQFNPDQDGFWVAVMNEQIVGAIAIDGSDADNSKARLRWFIVDPNYQGEGLGRLLLQTAIEFCRSVGFQEIYLWTAVGLSAAHHLYRQFGFSLVETVKDDRWGGPDHQKFVCALTPQK